MRKIGILVTLGLVVILAPNAQAATNPKAVTAAFTKVLSATDNSLEALELKYESDIDSLDTALASATKAANDAYKAREEEVKAGEEPADPMGMGM